MNQIYIWTWLFEFGKVGSRKSFSQVWILTFDPSTFFEEKVRYQLTTKGDLPIAPGDFNCIVYPQATR